MLRFFVVLLFTVAAMWLFALLAYSLPISGVAAFWLSAVVGNVLVAVGALWA